MQRSNASVPSRLRNTLAFCGAAAVMALSAGVAHAQNDPVSNATTGADASGNYATERAACMNGRTQQAQATCLEEARNAAADKKRGVLSNSNGDYAANEMRRCDVFQNAEDKAACVARVEGGGMASGSVAGGGVIRGVETIVVPSGERNVRIEPQTADPVILVPVRATTY